MWPATCPNNTSVTTTANAARGHVIRRLMAWLVDNAYSDQKHVAEMPDNIVQRRHEPKIEFRSIALQPLQAM